MTIEAIAPTVLRLENGFYIMKMVPFIQNHDLF